LLQESPVR